MWNSCFGTRGGNAVSRALLDRGFVGKDHPVLTDTGVARRRRFTTEQKLLVVNETLQPGLSISYVARRHGLSPSLVFRWRRLMSEGGKEAVRADEDVVAASEVRRLEERVRELERLLGRKTMEVEILKQALDLARVKKPTLLSRSQLPEDTP